MDALSLIRRDHREMRKLLAQLEPTSDRAVRTRARLFAQIRAVLDAHESVEEEIFYPALRDQPATRAIVLEAYEEHGVVESLLDELAELPMSDRTWRAKARLMKENLEHHFETEERDLLSRARQLFDTGELGELGRRMAERKSSVPTAAGTSAR